MTGSYKIGIYIRLSLADEDTGHSKDESDSVGNQRLLINRYLDNDPELCKCPRFEFVDDGYTGTNFDRPQFTAMMEKVKAGEINLLCVKDFSRFSRDYIETGNYLECVFPFLGVRFISINDRYDSDNYKGTTGGLDVVMRSIIYAAYSKDLSVKTTSAKIHMMKQGKYVGGYAPFGYQLHPTIPNKLAIDAESAAIVRHIFDLALSGCNTSVIAEMLNDEKAPTPGQYFQEKHPGKRKYNSMSDKISWKAAMVSKILQNYVYTGAAVGHRRKKAGVGNRKTLAQDPSDWIVVEGMHEAIVSKEEFEAAQAVIRGGVKGVPREAGHYPLRGLVHCGNCGRVMCRRKYKDGSVAYSCHHSIHDKGTECAVNDRYDEMELEKFAYKAIEQVVSLTERKAVENQGVSQLRQDAIKECLAKLRNLQKQTEQYKGVKLRWYEKYSSDSISREEYLKHKQEADTKLSEISEATQQLEDRLRELEAERPCTDEHLEAVCREFSQTESLTYELAHAFIKAIYVYPDNRIEISWKFRDIYGSIV